MCNKITRPHQTCDKICTTRIRRCSDADDHVADNQRNLDEDLLAVSTVYLKLGFNLIQEFFSKLKNTRMYSIITRTTQPAHALVMLASLLIVAFLCPCKKEETSNLIVYKFVYAAAAAAHFGSQIWMTFASGLSLYFSLPRHHFGEVQKVLFPLYFTMTSLLSLVTLLSHMRLSQGNETTLVLSICFFTELFVRLYLCGPLVGLICVKNKMEAQHGLGMEVGKLSKDSDLFSKQDYVAVHNKFRRLHMSVAMSNVACIALSTVHLFLAVSHIEFNS